PLMAIKAAPISKPNDFFIIVFSRCVKKRTVNYQ
ncbi:MAG: hypothetical protein RL563_415, partial [Pseudomonadota bacterium]